MGRALFCHRSTGVRVYSVGPRNLFRLLALVPLLVLLYRVREREPRQEHPSGTNTWDISGQGEPRSVAKQQLQCCSPRRLGSRSYAHHVAVGKGCATRRGAVVPGKDDATRFFEQVLVCPQSQVQAQGPTPARSRAAPALSPPRRQLSLRLLQLLACSRNFYSCSGCLASLYEYT